MKNKLITMNDGNKIPQIALGTWLLEQKDAEKVTFEAVTKQGYLHIDTAQVYDNEYEIGQSIAKMDRSKIFITTKVWISNFKNEETFLKSVKQSIKRLQVEQIDLLLLHWPFKGYNVKAWKYLIKAKKQGLVKSIGVSNYTVPMLEEIIEKTKVVPAVNQIMFTPIVQQKDVVKFCKKNKIAVEGYSAIKSYNAKELSQLEREAIDSVAKKHSKTGQEVIFRFAYQEGLIILPKSVNPKRRATNKSIEEWKLDTDDMKLLRKLDRNNYTHADEIYNHGSWSEASFKKSYLFVKHMKR